MKQSHTYIILYVEHYLYNKEVYINIYIYVGDIYIYIWVGGIHILILYVELINARTSHLPTSYERIYI